MSLAFWLSCLTFVWVFLALLALAERHRVIGYLRAHEWSMGCGGRINEGQCPDCCGLSFAWVRDQPVWQGPAGHTHRCPLARILAGLGASIVWQPA